MKAVGSPYDNDNDGFNNTLSEKEVDVRHHNNQLYELTQKSEIALDDFKKLDEIQADKARAVLEGYARANPDAVAAVQSMVATYQSSDMVESLLEILTEITEARGQAGISDDRYQELTALIDIIEKMLVVHVADMRAERPFWMFGSTKQ